MQLMVDCYKLSVLELMANFLPMWCLLFRVKNNKITALFNQYSTFRAFIAFPSSGIIIVNTIVDDVTRKTVRTSMSLKKSRILIE